jgi:dephospho-CoA kinase
MIVLGLTGGIGMGKSTASAIFRRARIPVFDADAQVHRLQSPGGRALPAIASAFPGTVIEGTLDRARLRAAVIGDPAALRRLEAILHPMVRAAETRFLAGARRRQVPLVVLDIPLLFETGGADRVDRIIVVSAPPSVQLARVRKRRRMAPEQIAAIIARQMPDAAKRRRADHVVRTGLSRHHAQQSIRRLIRGIRQGPPAAGA